MRAYPLTAREFPDFPIASLPPIPAKWQEMSWHNDTAPSFGIMHPDDNRPLLQVYVDYPDPTMREFPDAPYRYVLIVGDNRDVTTSNDWDTILDAALNALSEIYAAYCDEQGLPAMSADELILSGVCTPKQTGWLSAFIHLWEATLA